MPHDPSRYGAAPRPGGASSDPYGAGAHPRHGAPDRGDRTCDGAAPTAGPPGSAPPTSESWHPVSTPADHQHENAAPGFGRYASPGSWTWLRPRVGKVLHGLVRTGRWVTGAAVLAVVAGIVLFTQINGWDTEVPLDGSPVTVAAERGGELWVWLPEDRYAVACRAHDADGLDLRPWVLLRQPLSNDFRAVYAVPTGSTGSVEISCEPDPGGYARAPSPDGNVRLGVAPPSWQVTGYYLLLRGGLVTFLWAAGTTAVLWIVWGVLRAVGVLPRLRTGGRPRRRRGHRGGPGLGGMAGFDVPGSGGTAPKMRPPRFR